MRASIQLLIAGQILLSASTSIAIVKEASSQTAASIMKAGIGHKVQKEGKSTVSTGELACVIQCAYQSTMLVDKIDCTTVDGAEKHFHIESSTANASDTDRSFRAMLRIGMGNKDIPYKVISDGSASLLKSCEVHLNKIECESPAGNPSYDEYKCKVFTDESSTPTTDAGKIAPKQSTR